MPGREVKGIDVIGLVRALRGWRKKNGDAPIPGLNPADQQYFERSRILASAWYPLDAWLRLLALTHRLCFGGKREGMIAMGKLSCRETYTGPYAVHIRKGDVRKTLETFVSQIRSHHNFGQWSITFVGQTATLTVSGYREMTEVHGTLYIGWFEVMVELAGGKMTDATIDKGPWLTDPEYKLTFSWT